MARASMHVERAVAIVLCIVAASGCHGDTNRSISRPVLVTAPSRVTDPPPDTPASVPTTPIVPSVPPVTVMATGDIVVCGDRAPEATAALVDGMPGEVLTLGDHVYTSGTHREFGECYHASWGRHRSRTWPTPGNHDYETPGAEGYFNYFGARAGTAGMGYYTFTTGAWRLYSLNSEVPAGPGSRQYEWLKQELINARPPLARGLVTESPDSSSPTATDAGCSLAYWHKPLLSSGKHGNNNHMLAIWRLLHEHGVDVVLAAHDHTYERFAPLDGHLQLSATDGIRSFVVGTGGAPIYTFPTVRAHSEARGSAHGVLKLLLKSDGYDWEFVPVPGQSFNDFGTGTCR